MVFDFFPFYSTTIETLVKNNKESNQVASMQIRAVIIL
jgi:hypothetical protein